MPGDEANPPHNVRTHVVIPTHLPRYLDLVLAALARQSRRPDTVVVTCDTSREDIGEVIDARSHRFGLPVLWVRRAHMEGERLSQIRNNAARVLAERLGISSARRVDPYAVDALSAGHRVVTIDGDMVSPDDFLEKHASIHERAASVGAEPPLVYAYRIDVPEPISAAVDAQALFTSGPGGVGLVPTSDDLARLARRDRRYRKHLLTRRVGVGRWRLGPLHKPKLLGGHFSCTLDQYLRLNGFDEHYRGWGFKDDEIAYRAARLGMPVAVRVREIPAFHLYHATRQADTPMRELPNAERFARRASLPLACENGVNDPIPQAEVCVTSFG